MSDSKREKCPYCKELVDDEATKCPRCHSDLTSWAESNKKKKQGAGCIGMIVLAIIIGVGVYNKDDKKSSSNTNIQTEQVAENETDFSDNNEEKIATYNTAEQTNDYAKETNSEDIVESIDMEEEEVEVYNDLLESKTLDFEAFKQLVGDIRKTDFDKIKKDNKGIIRKVAAFKNESNYEFVILFVIENNKELNKKWQKDGRYFDNQIEFYEAFISGKYKAIIKSKK